MEKETTAKLAIVRKEKKKRNKYSIKVVDNNLKVLFFTLNTNPQTPEVAKLHINHDQVNIKSGKFA